MAEMVEVTEEYIVSPCCGVLPTIERVASHMPLFGRFVRGYVDWSCPKCFRVWREKREDYDEYMRRFGGAE